MIDTTLLQTYIRRQEMIHDDSRIDRNDKQR